MRKISGFWSAALLGAVLITPLALVPSALRAQEQGAVIIYHDKAHHDDHQWNDREGQAYVMYGNQYHYQHRDFHTLNAHEQQAYWNWRHHHSDAVLKIDVH
jgi:hypothetical protein